MVTTISSSEPTTVTAFSNSQDPVSQLAKQKLKKEKARSNFSLAEKEIRPALSKARLALGLTCVLIPGLIQLFLHQKFSSKLEKSASKLVQKLNEAVASKDIKRIFEALHKINTKIVQIPSRFVYRYLGIGTDVVKINLLNTFLKQQAETLEEPLEEYLFRLKSYFNEGSPEADEALKLIEGLIYFHRAVQQELPSFISPADQRKELDLRVDDTTPAVLEMDELLETVQTPPSQELSLCDETVVDTVSRRSTETDTLPICERPSSYSSISSLEDTTASPAPSVEQAPPAPAPKLLSPKDRFLNWLHSLDCIHTKEFFWTLFVGMNVETVHFDEAAGNFEIVLDKPYTVHIPNMKKAGKGEIFPPGPNAPQLKFAKVLTGKITKKETQESVEFQDCLTASAVMPIVGRKEVGFIRSMSIQRVPGDLVMKFKLPIVGEQTVPFATFWHVMNSSCILPTGVISNRNPEETIGAIRAKFLAFEAAG
jgi:hypothetical protein